MGKNKGTARKSTGGLPRRMLVSKVKKDGVDDEDASLQPKKDKKLSPKEEEMVRKEEEEEREETQTRNLRGRTLEYVVPKQTAPKSKAKSKAVPSVPLPIKKNKMTAQPKAIPKLDKERNEK